MPPSKATAQRALRMRTAGIPYEKIADELGITTGKARDAVADALSKAAAEPTEVATRIELERLDAMLVGLWKQVTRGDVKAVEQAMKISERRAQLLATGDAPQDSAVGEYLDQLKTRALDDRPDATLHTIDGSDQ